MKMTILRHTVSQTLAHHGFLFTFRLMRTARRKTEPLQGHRHTTNALHSAPTACVRTAREPKTCSLIGGFATAYKAIGKYRLTSI